MKQWKKILWCAGLGVLEAVSAEAPGQIQLHGGFASLFSEKEPVTFSIRGVPAEAVSDRYFSECRSRGEGRTQSAGTRLLYHPAGEVVTQFRRDSCSSGNGEKPGILFLSRCRRRNDRLRLPV